MRSERGSFGISRRAAATRPQPVGRTRSDIATKPSAESGESRPCTSRRGSRMRTSRRRISVCDSKSPSEPLSNRHRNAQASSIPTGSTLPVRLCLRSLMKVSVMAQTEVIEPFNQRAVSMQ